MESLYGSRGGRVKRVVVTPVCMQEIVMVVKALACQALTARMAIQPRKL